MWRLAWVAIIALAAPFGARAQSSASNPLTSQLRQVFDSYANNVVAAAEEFPADKYTYHPTPEGMTVGRTIAHVTQANNFVCASVGSLNPPPQVKVADTDKDKLVEGLKTSINFCRQAFSTLTDAKLVEPVPGFGGRPSTRFAMAMDVTTDLVDHYATLSVYLRINGLLPPSAQKRK